MSSKVDFPADIITVTEAPSQSLEQKWNSLHGIDTIKHLVLDHLHTCLDDSKMESWCKKYYPDDASLQEALRAELGFSGKVLFVGHPGTGKTQFVEGLSDALAKKMGKLYLIKVSSMRSQYVGMSSQKVSKAFRYAKEKAKEAPVLLFIDEFDSVAPARDQAQMHEEIKAAVNTLLKEIDSVTPQDRVVVIAATNLFEQAVDSAADRRFDMVVHFNRPNFFQRLNMLNILLKPLDISFEDRYLLARRTEGYTQADVKKVLKHALNKSLCYNRKLCAKDLFESLRYVRPTRRYSGESLQWKREND